MKNRISILLTDKQSVGDGQRIRTLRIYRKYVRKKIPVTETATGINVIINELLYS